MRSPASHWIIAILGLVHLTTGQDEYIDTDYVGIPSRPLVELKRLVLKVRESDGNWYPGDSIGSSPVGQPQVDPHASYPDPVQPASPIQPIIRYGLPPPIKPLQRGYPSQQIEQMFPDESEYPPAQSHPQPNEYAAEQQTVTPKHPAPSNPSNPIPQTEYTQAQPLPQPNQYPPTASQSNTQPQSEYSIHNQPQPPATNPQSQQSEDDGYGGSSVGGAVELLPGSMPMLTYSVDGRPLYNGNEPTYQSNTAGTGYNSGSGGFMTNGHQNYPTGNTNYASSGQSGMGGAPPIPPCVNGLILCGNLDRCITEIQMCNGVNDCGDSSDERACSTPIRCWPSEFACASRTQCVLSVTRFRVQKCNGIPDCTDGSDEQDCVGPPGTKPDETTTTTTTTAASAALVLDASTSLAVTVAPVRRAECAKVGMTSCADGRGCIYSEMACDGHVDCADESDEHEQCNLWIERQQTMQRLRRERLAKERLQTMTTGEG